MGVILRGQIRRWVVRLEQRQGNAAAHHVGATCVLSKALAVSGQAEPLTELDVQVYGVPNEHMGLAGVGRPTSLNCAIFMLELFEEVVTRHRYGGVLNGELVLEIEGLVGTGDGISWNKQASPQLVISWVNLNFVTQL